jgi:hypothetical protein
MAIPAAVLKRSMPIFAAGVLLYIAVHSVMAGLDPAIHE